MRLKSNISPELLAALIEDVARGSASDFTFLDTGEKLYVSTHEVVFDKDSEIIAFSDSMTTFLTSMFGKSVPFSRHHGNKEAQYSTFVSFFSAQAGIVRILWLDGKILSMLVGSKPLRISKTKEKKDTALEYNPYYFGFAPECAANTSLNDEDKAALMTLSQSSWFVSKERDGVIPNNPESSKSLSVARGYVRHGSIEKIVGIDDLFLLMYPKEASNFFSQGGSWGSGMPSLCKTMAKFEYNDLIDTQLMVTGEWQRYRDYDNNVFIASKDSIKPFVDQRLYYRFSFNSITAFQALKEKVKPKDIIVRKCSVMVDEDVKKYFDNPRYCVVHSPDKTMYYVTKSDKLKATALQTRITKSIREDFIHFLNWIGYFQLAADLETGLMVNHFMPVKLSDLKNANWVDQAFTTLTAQKLVLEANAKTQFRDLYLGGDDNNSTVNVLGDRSIFSTIFQKHITSGYRHSSTPEGAYKLLHDVDNPIFSFNKKFALNVDLSNILVNFVRGTNDAERQDTGSIYYNNMTELLSFLNTNFLVSDKVEKAYEAAVNSRNPPGRGQVVNSVPVWSFQYDSALKEDQLLKTCVTLSPEALMIFNSVANLSTPTDIMSWLELARPHFTEVLPGLLVAKYGNQIASESRISALLNTGIEYYLSILTVAEPFSTKLLSEDSTDETGA